MLAVLESLKSKLEPHEIVDFERRITSLNSNVVYWTKRLSHELKTERDEALFELKRMDVFFAKIAKEFKKIEAKD